MSAKWFIILNRQILSDSVVIPKVFCLFAVTERKYARRKLCDVRIIFFISLNKQMDTIWIEDPCQEELCHVLALACLLH